MYAHRLSEADLSAKPDAIGDVIEARARELGDKPYLRFLGDGEEISYRDIDRSSAEFGKGLLAFGLAPGDKLGLLLGGSRLYVTAWFAALRASIPDVAINSEFRGDVLDHAIRKIEVSAIISDADGLDALATAGAEALSQVKLLVVPDEIYDRAMALYMDRGAIGRIIRVSEVEAAGRASVQPFAKVESTGLASIRFSSGTTGMPKGVMMDHGHMLASARKFNDLADLGTDDVHYSCFPFHHVFATITGVLSTLCAGATLIVSRKFSASRYWREIRENGVTRAHILDPLIALLMKQPPSERDRQHKVPVMYTAAGHYPDFEERFGVRIISLYDMSELTVVAHYPEGVERKPGSCGMPSGLFDIMIADDDGFEVPDGTDGEILVRPRHRSIMFMGYYNDAEQTVARWRDMWFETGDRGRKDPDGYFYFLGRSGDRIRRRGVNISADQIEKIALAHPHILECSAIAVPSDVNEDDIKLCAKLTPAAACHEADILEYLREALPKAMTVRYVELFDDLPKTQTEKIKRADLRRMGQAGLTPATWDCEIGAYWAMAEVMEQGR
ncbi:AMP-binding protein [Sphingobium aquiterrae]|uniref:AMP-binding protein n=1 Tax=Sphingobium aquiterrae TaxID=2038656 RepID=UPI00301A36DF